MNTKRRQHLQASLSTYLQKEWLTHYSDTGLSAKDLLKVYTDYFEPEDKKVNGESPKAGGPGGRGTRGRNRGGRTAASRGGRGALTLGQRQKQVPELNAGAWFFLFFILRIFRH